MVFSTEGVKVKNLNTINVINNIKSFCWETRFYKIIVFPVSFQMQDLWNKNKLHYITKIVNETALMFTFTINIPWKKNQQSQCLIHLAIVEW